MNNSGLGFIEYNGGLRVHSSLLSVVLTSSHRRVWAEARKAARELILSFQSAHLQARSSLAVQVEF